MTNSPVSVYVEVPYDFGSFIFQNRCFHLVLPPLFRSIKSIFFTKSPVDLTGNSIMAVEVVIIIIIIIGSKVYEIHIFERSVKELINDKNVAVTCKTAAKPEPD